MRLRFARYSAVSVVSVLVTQGALVACHVALAWSAVASNFAAVSIGAVPAYALNRAWVWGRSGRSGILREALPFWAMSLAGLALSALLVAAAQVWWPGSTLALNAANLGAFGLLWVTKFTVCEEVLFA